MVKLLNPELENLEVAIFEVNDDGVALITMNRPEAANSLNTAIHHDVVACFEEVNNNPEIKAAVITGTGRFFCAGRDVKEYVDTYGEAKDVVRAIDDPDNPMFGRLANHWPIKKPFIGALNGAAVGGGLEMSTMCDMIVMSKNSYIASLHAKVNVGAGNLPKFAMVLPLNIARELAMTERRITPEECLQWGYANRVVEPEELIPTAMAMAKATTVMGPDALKGLKMSSLRIQEAAGNIEIDVDWEKRREERRKEIGARRQKEQQDADLLEGMKAFVERREAHYEKPV